MADISPASTRLIALLVKIRDGLEQSSESILKQVLIDSETGLPISVPEGTLPLIAVDHDDVTTAAMYLRDVGLKYDALRLERRFNQLSSRCVGEGLASMAEGSSQEYRNSLTEFFGAFPSEANPNDPVVADRRVMIAGMVGQLSKLVDELISSVKALSKTQPDAAGKANECEGNAGTGSKTNDKPAAGGGEGKVQETKRRQPRKRKRKPDPKTLKKREERDKRQEMEEAIADDWEKGQWTAYQDYVRWKNEHLPDGWPKLDHRTVERAIDNVRRRTRYRDK